MIRLQEILLVLAETVDRWRWIGIGICAVIVILAIWFYISFLDPA